MLKTLNQWLSELENLHPEEIELGLNRVRDVYSRLPIAGSLPSVITVSGTNGKGSTVCMLEKIALSQNLAVGTYTSPHLFVYNERVRLNGQDVSDSCLITAFEQVKQALNGVTLTYFEFGTLAALLIFAQHSLDLVVLEVGLGGRLDAVNIIDADVAVITSIAIDHVDWLGSDRESIGYEKIGIAREQGVVVCGDINPPNSMLRVMADLHVTCLQQGIDYSLSVGADGKRCFVGVGKSTAEEWVIDDIPKNGLLLSNVATAIQAFLRIETLTNLTSFRHAVQHAHLKGRQQWSGKYNNVLLDVGHNPHAADQIVKTISESRFKRRVFCVFGILEDKDRDSVVSILLPVITDWLPCGLPGVPRAVSSANLCSTLVSLNAHVLEVYSNPIEAFERLANMTHDDLVLVFGSFYTVSPVLSLLTKDNALI